MHDDSLLTSSPGMDGPQSQATTTFRQGEKDIERLFRCMPKFGASDLHLKAGSAPVLRIAGALRHLDRSPLSDADVRRIAYEILTPEQQRRLEKTGDLDLSYEVSGEVRVRLNMFVQRGTLSVAARFVNSIIPTFDDLHMPTATMERISSFDAGMVVVAGITGSGKSTTLASMIEHINQRRRCHIVTIEDPIEYIYTDKKAHINQREVGLDTASFKTAIKYVLRQDPDVILLGEMRDDETVLAGLIASETGHLVFGTLHSGNVVQTFTRILDLFPGDKTSQIRRSLEHNLKAIICQKLLPCALKKPPRVPAIEIMISTPAIAKLIDEGKDERLMDAVKQGASEGMIDFTRSLVGLVQSGMITEEVALQSAPNPDALQANLQGIYFDTDTHR